VLIAPAVLALNGAAIIVTLLLLTGAGFAIQVLRHWDMASGSERQLALERRTYLISTLVTWCFASEIVSLLLFVYNAEQMSTQFVGAMCATGVLNAAPWGWTTLGLKIAVFFAAAAWLMLNRVDSQAPDYPLVRVKYGLLLAIVPLAATEALAQWTFFRGLNPDVITSCCGALFTAEGDGVAGEISALDPALSLAALYLAGVALLGAGIRYRLRGRGGGMYALLSSGTFVVALAALVSCIALYVYEHPHHHCPFCLLKSGHGYIGYWLYIPLFAATALGLGIGLIERWRQLPSLTRVIAEDGRRFANLSLAAFAFFFSVSTYAVIRSGLTMRGVWW
jgi:hypothetical protein